MKLSTKMLFLKIEKVGFSLKSNDCWVFFGDLCFLSEGLRNFITLLLLGFSNASVHSV